MNRLILNKIKHKNLLIEKIFPYSRKRPIILLILFNNDYLLKESVKKAFKSLKKNNNLGSDINEIFKKFISYRKVFETNLYEEYFLNFDYLLDCFKNVYFFQELLYTIIKNYQELDYEIFYNFILDYFHWHKKFCLYIYPDREPNIQFIKKLGKNMSNINIEIEIDLIIFLDGVNLGNNENTKTVFEQLNLKVKNIYLAFAKKKNFTLKKFSIQIEKIIDFINNLKNKETIKKISVKHLSNKWKYFLEYLNKHKLYLEGLENIEYSEKNMTLYQKFISRYSIYNYINKNIFCKLIVITPDDFNNIKELKEEQKHNLKYKLNSFEHNGHINNTNLKMLVLDFENNSPYQHNFIYFCRNYLAYDDNINTVIINNIGKINSQINCKKNIKDSLMHFEKLDNIVYENNLNNNDINENEIKELISFLFYTENLVYLTTIFSKNNKLQFLLYSNKFYIKNIINKINLNKQDIIIKIYFDNIIYELNFCNKELILAQSNSNSEDTEINVDEIIIMINKIKKKI